MNGRLAFPVRNELLGRLDEHSDLGIDESCAHEAADKAEVLDAKRLYKTLNDNGVDQNRSKIFIASLRIYEGEAYQDLPNTFPDINEINAASIQSVFPNIRHSFDQADHMVMNPLQIKDPEPDHIPNTLAHSEIFKQAHHVADRA